MFKYILLIGILLLSGCSAPKENLTEQSNVDIQEGTEVPEIVIDDDM